MVLFHNEFLDGLKEYFFKVYDLLQSLNGQTNNFTSFLFSDL
jgi:hypothetical protein